MELNKKKKDVEKEEPKQVGTTNNNLFIGSTTELQRFLQNEQKVIDAEPIREE